MQGRGVINYSTSKPSHAFTTNTTEFDDALLSRGIITMEQAMLAKGASAEEAMRLVTIKELEKMNKNQDTNVVYFDSNKMDEDDTEDDDIDETDDHFLHSYRTKRLHELQCTYTNPVLIPSITRSEWTRSVNQASQDGTWVFIFLNCTSSSSTSNAFYESCIYMEQSIFPLLASKYQLEMVQIPVHHAISNWPEENLPTLFLYRFGTLQHQWVGWKDFGYTKFIQVCTGNLDENQMASQMNEVITKDEFQLVLNYLEIIFSDLQVIELNQEDKNEKQDAIANGCRMALQRGKEGSRWGHFSGSMMSLRTKRGDQQDDDNDYDEVD